VKPLYLYKQPGSTDFTLQCGHNKSDTKVNFVKMNYRKVE